WTRRGRWCAGLWAGYRSRVCSICLRFFFLFRLVALSAPETVHQIFQIAPHHFFEQVCFSSFECSADFEIDRAITGLLRRLKIRPDRLEKLRANFFINGKTRTQMKFTANT